MIAEPSSKHSDDFGIGHPPLRAHDAVDDALSVSYVLQHFLRERKLVVSDFQERERAKGL